ncbi:MAG: malate dehydrogenase (quinone) [Alphaproteobacteria bacterium]|nr:malate dehydrogenase (quinone) [Alphaproteobacteria bacterium]
MAEEVHDVVLVGAGIMSATLGTLLRELDPGLSVRIFERMDTAATESSDAWNNAGTGHSAFCELNYTPEGPDGSVDVTKAVRIAEQFELSKQLWAALVASGALPAPERFIRTVPHLAFVWGEDAVAFLHARFRAMQGSPLFAGMEISTDPEQLAEWAPLIMEGRDPSVPVAATRMAIGNDVDFGTIARSLIGRLDTLPGVVVHYGHEVRDLRREDGVWRVTVHDLDSRTDRVVRTRFLFLGAGGGTLELLEASGIPEGAGFGGFPVSGQFLRCTNPDVIARHEAKVYGKAAVGAPPMSVPHLDTRWIEGQRNLLFGPYAGFSTKFLKQGSYLDLLKSIGIDNIAPLVAAGAQNLDLTRYLVGQVLLDPEDRLAMLRQYLPGARDEDWELEIAGQRVQIIKRDPDRVGRLQFGTEVVTSADGSIAALLGASPGASTAVAIMLDVITRCFPERVQAGWDARLRELLQSWGRSLHDDPALCAQVRARSIRALNLGFKRRAGGIVPFHLAFPVSDLAATEAFYVGVLGARAARRDTRWIDFDFWGHQISAHLGTGGDPSHNDVDGESIPVRHFGVVLDWDAWEALAARVRAAGVPFRIAPTVRFPGEVGEQGTFFVDDPSGNALEFKSFRDPERLFAT